MEITRLSIDYLRAVRYTEKFGAVNDYRQIPRPFSSIAYIYSGGASFQQGDNSGIVTTGDIYYIPRGATYISYWNGQPETVFYSCHFNFASPEICSERDCAVERITGLCHLREDFVELVNRFKCAEAIDEQLDLLARFYRILTEVVSRLPKRKGAPPDSSLLEAVSYLHTHYKEHISVAELARMCSLSESHFYARFRKAYNLSPIEYKNRLLISQAELMLCDSPSMTIEQISELLGFESDSYFRRLFKKLLGMSPREYRARQSGGL